MDIFYKLNDWYKANPDKTAVDIYRSVDDKNISSDQRGKYTLIHIAAKNADVEGIDYLINEAGVKANVSSDYGETPLHLLANISSGYNAERVARSAELLIKGKVSALKKDDNDLTCYHIAAENGVYPAINELVKAGAMMKMVNSMGQNVMHIACYSANNAIKSLDFSFKQYTRLEKEKKDADFSPSNNDNWAYESYMRDKQVVDGLFIIVKTMMEYGMDPSDKDNAGKTPLDYASEAGAANIALLLKGELEESDPQLLDIKLATKGKTVHQAAKDSDIKALDALIKLKADVNEILYDKEFKDLTPLAVACCSFKDESVKLLLEAGADVNLKMGEHGETALCKLLTVGFGSFKTLDKIIKYMAKAGLEYDATVDDKANTALILATYPSRQTSYNNRSIDSIVFDELISVGADVNKSNQNGVTPLMVACANLEENKVIALLEGGADVSAADKFGNTPLMALASQRDGAVATSIAQIMKDFGDIKINSVNNDGKTALEIATNANNETMVKFILERM